MLNGHKFFKWSTTTIILNLCSFISFFIRKILKQPMLHSSHSYNACSGRCFGSYATSVKELFLKQPLRLLSKWSLRPSKVNTVNEIKILTTKNHHKIWFFFFIFLLFFFFLLFLCKSKILIVFLVSLKSPSFMTHHMSSIANG